MEELVQRIEQLNDREFAFFYYYRYPKFSAPSKKIIDSVRVSRYLDKSKIDKVVHEQVEIEEGHCLRCNSDHFHTESEVEPHGRTVGFKSNRRWILSDMCVVCGYNADRAKPISWRVRLGKIFGKYRRYME